MIQIISTGDKESNRQRVIQESRLSYIPKKVYYLILKNNI